jgi:hypothetical protein
MLQVSFCFFMYSFFFFECFSEHLSCHRKGCRVSRLSCEKGASEERCLRCSRLVQLMESKNRFSRHLCISFASVVCNSATLYYSACSSFDVVYYYCFLSRVTSVSNKQVSIVSYKSLFRSFRFNKTSSNFR